jgi:glycerol-3-phosphate O-acyltransferase
MKRIHPLNYIGRKLLYLWAKVEVVPTSAEQLKLDPDTPVIYVLEQRSWSSLLVLEQECSRLGLISPLARLPTAELRYWHSVYTIAPRQPFKAWLQNQPKRSRMIRGILETLVDNPALDIQFVPVSIFWGRPVAKQKSAIGVLFAHSWGVAGRIRQFFRILFHGRETLVQFSAAINLRSILNARLENDENIDNIQQTLADRLLQVKTATLGPDTSHRRTLVRDLLLLPEVQEAIQKRSIEDNKSHYKAALQARKYLYEIVADRTNITIRLMQIGLTSFWNRFYSGIKVYNAEQLRNLALTHELVYVPCHRSHVDYLLLSYVIHYQGLSIPHIAAGRNLNMPVIGSILRGGGAFFIRRSFKGNELYSTVMFEYLAKLVSMGTPVEYFVEGGRSRTGRLLKPKSGMLSMTVRAFLKYRSRPVAFVPVYIGYEKMIEGKAYLAELSGRDKKAESLLSSVRAILGIRGNFGHVYTNFGTPVMLTQHLDNANPNWPIQEYDDSHRPDWLKRTVDDVANHIMVNINRATHVNAINLVSTVLLATPKQHMDEGQLIAMIEIYSSLIRSLDYSSETMVTSLSGQEQVERAELLKRIKRRKHKMGDILYIDAKNSILLTYYRNNILHLTALPSVIACCFNNAPSQKLDHIVSMVSIVYPFLRRQLFISWTQEQLPGTIEHILDILVQLKLLKKRGKNEYVAPRASSVEYAQLELLAKVISPMLELYYMTFAILLNTGSNRISGTDLTEHSYLMAQRVSMIHDISSPDYFDTKVITNFIDTLKDIDYVRIDNDGMIEYSDDYLKVGEDAVSLLNKNIRSGILQLLNANRHGKKA